LITTIVLQKKGIDLDDESANESDLDTKRSTSFGFGDIPREMTSHFRKQVDDIANFIDRKIGYLENSNITNWKEELLVCIHRHPLLYSRTNLHITLKYDSHSKLAKCYISVIYL
jgi:hypothetical protein